MEMQACKLRAGILDTMKVKIFESADLDWQGWIIGTGIRDGFEYCDVMRTDGKILMVNPADLT